MKIILLGNAGAGKSTLSRKLLEKEDAALLCLDEVAFEENTANRRPVADSVAAATRFIAANSSWIIEGCYASIIQPLLGYCDQLLFLNPGTEACVAHCRARPWEPEKFASRNAQDAQLQKLLDWVRLYDCRENEYGLKQHRRLFDSFAGRKVEYTDASQYASRRHPQQQAKPGTEQCKS